MKKLILPLVFFTLVINQLNAVNPVTLEAAPVNQKRVDSISLLVVNKIHNDVNLTEKQKTEIINRAKRFYKIMEEMPATKNNPNTFRVRKDAFDSFKASIDSILTPAQRTKMVEKITERKKAFEAQKESTQK